ncbi:translation initiation factor IF-2-like isoform X2 [Choloepus didactylus]|uniref:translation initiation factor IF-2-like isoform X2 n=1 Tax=Choloepus didactylus TaxID=27675 RepID=UPI0018A072A7|nr:translation initiation factor IF-2-like isoform X2 [Choloepus didactylus]
MKCTRNHVATPAPRFCARPQRLQPAPGLSPGRAPLARTCADLLARMSCTHGLLSPPETPSLLGDKPTPAWRCVTPICTSHTVGPALGPWGDMGSSPQVAAGARATECSVQKMELLPRMTSFADTPSAAPAEALCFHRCKEDKQEPWRGACGVGAAVSSAEPLSLNKHPLPGAPALATDDGACGWAGPGPLQGGRSIKGFQPAPQDLHPFSLPLGPGTPFSLPPGPAPLLSPPGPAPLLSPPGPAPLSPWDLHPSSLPPGPGTPSLCSCPPTQGCLMLQSLALWFCPTDPPFLGGPEVTAAPSFRVTSRKARGCGGVSARSPEREAPVRPPSHCGPWLGFIGLDTCASGGHAGWAWRGLCWAGTLCQRSSDSCGLHPGPVGEAGGRPHASHLARGAGTWTCSLRPIRRPVWCQGSQGSQRRASGSGDAGAQLDPPPRRQEELLPRAATCTGGDASPFQAWPRHMTARGHCSPETPGKAGIRGGDAATDHTSHTRTHTQTTRTHTQTTRAHTAGHTHAHTHQAASLEGTEAHVTAPPRVPPLDWGTVHPDSPGRRPRGSCRPRHT